MSIHHQDAGPLGSSGAAGGPESGRAQVSAQGGPSARILEEDLASTIDACIIGVCLTDERGNFLHVNEAYCDIYGYPPEEIIGRHFTMMSPDADRHELWQQIYDEFMETGHEMGGEWIVKARDGRLLTINTDAVRIGTADTGYRKVTFVHDLTDLRTLQSDIRRANGRLAALMEQPFLGVAVADAESMTVVTANRALLGMLGMRAADLVSRKLTDYLTPASEGWPALLEQIRTTREARMLLHHATAEAGRVGEAMAGYLQLRPFESANELILTLQLPISGRDL